MLQRTLPLKQGVGLARKIGHDCLLRIWQRGRVGSRFLYSTDADVVLPPDYFSDQDERAVALISPFRHLAEERGLEHAIERYDSWLRYRVLGLAYAGSPYAFHTIGSTIAIAATAYAQVRGFPRRQAGEDFYLLDKLRKVGIVSHANHSPIMLSGRKSDRVPFGTGRAMSDARSGSGLAWDRFDPKETYQRLAGVIQLGYRVLDGTLKLTEAAITRELEQLGRVVRDAAHLQRVPGELVRIFDSSPQVEQRRRAWDCWFDSFRTLKFINQLRAQQGTLLRFDQIGPHLEHFAPSLRAEHQEDWRQLHARVVAASERLKSGL